MDRNTALSIVYNLKWNFYTAVYTIVRPRDKHIWLFGSWMGQRFADNSRFLFQYLHENKEKYGIKRVIWVTESVELLEEIKSLGYEAYLMGTEESKYYHLKAGVHVICNSRESDICTKYSFGAKKIQLWHGNGIKASGKMTRKKGFSFKNMFWDNCVKPFLWPGNWFYCYWVASSEESKRVLIGDSGALENKIIIANSARLCKCLQFTVRETCVIKKLSSLKQDGYKIVIYLPTFRTAKQSVSEPLDIDGFTDFLEENNIVWIEKRHSAEDKLERHIYSNNVCYLDKDFDVNVLYEYTDLLISDYSSATTDAIYKDITTMEYCPDFQLFQNEDRGFVGNYEDYHIGNTIFKRDELECTILRCIREGVKDNPKHDQVKHFLFNGNKADYDDIMCSLLSGIKWQGYNS